MENFPTPKSEADIKKQLQIAEDQLGTRLDINGASNIKEIGQLKEKYPERYNVYLKLLRSNKNRENPEISDAYQWISILNNLDDYIINHNKNIESRILRGRQANVFEDIKDSLEKGKKEGYIKLPTGTGKTVLFSQVVESIGCKSLIVVPSKVLVSQTGERLEEFTDMEFGKYYQDQKDISKNVTVTTYSSLVLGIESGTIKPEDYGLLVLDETHKALGEKTVKAIEKFNGIKLGFTATPEYSSNKRVGDILENEIHSMSIVEGIQEGLINRFKSIFAYTTTDLSSVPIDRNQDYNRKDLENAINNKARNLSAVELYKKMFNNDTAVAYCGGVKHATDLAKLFNERGVSAEVVSGTTSPDERKKIFEKFHSGEIKILCNARLLIEGFDEPRASVALNLHPTLSKVDAEQRGGRVLRLDKDNPDKWAYIVDFIDENSKEPSVTFPEIARQSQVVPMKKEEDNTKTDKEGGDNNKISTNELPEIDGLRVVVDAEEVLEIAKEGQKLRESLVLAEAPEGWMNANEIHLKYGFNYGRIQKEADVYRTERANWLGDYKGITGSAEYYHPNLIREVVEKLKLEATFEKAPDGWSTIRALRSEVGGSIKTVTSTLEKYRESHKESFKTYKTKTHLIKEHIGPEVVRLVSAELKNEKAPNGWLTASILRRQLGNSDRTIRVFAEKYRKTHQEWFEDYKVRSKDIEHYHPDLVLLIKDKFKENKITETAPEGWQTISTLTKNKGYAYETIEKIAERFQDSKPEWFADYKARTKIAKHYHPDLIKKIHKYYEEKNAIPPAPNDWFNSYNLALQVGRDTLVIKDLAEPYREKHSEWFKDFKSNKYQVAEYYHPDLVNIILSNFNK